MRQFFFFVFFLLVSCISAREQSAPLASACRTLSEKYIFSNCTQRIYLDPGCQCNDQQWMGSMALCISDNGNNEQGNEEDWKYVRRIVCREAANATVNTVSIQTILANATKFVTPLPANATADHLYGPIRFPQKELINIIRTVKEFNNQLQYGLNYGGACSALVGIFIVFGIFNNLFHHCFSWRYNLTINTNAKPKALPSSPSWMRSIRRHIINPSLFFDGVHLENASWFGVMVNYPTRLESIFISLYVILNIFILFPSYDLFPENTYWPDDIPAQLARYVADRSGEMSFAQLPMVYLFGGRNNILIWLTGWSYDRFIIAHKWTSRMMMFQALVHSIAYTWVSVHFGYYEYYFEGLYFQWGVVATILGSFVLLLAIPNLRRKCYDLFLYTHIVFVVLFTVACWYHVALLEDEENMPFLYASIAVWSFDRVARFVRVVYYNIMLVIGRRCLRSVKADIIPGTDCIRFRVDANKSGLSHRLPGAFVYIYVPGVYFWQSHPFTIASWHQPSLDKPACLPVVPPDPSENNADGTIKKPRPASPDSGIKINEIGSASSTSSTSTTTEIGNTFDLLIRPQQGMTKKLYDAVEKFGPDGGDMYVLIEGPYGHTHPVLQYDTAILVGGGVGCTATVPYLQEAVYNANKNATRHLVFVWVVQHDDQLNWAQQDIEECLSHVNLSKSQASLTGKEDQATGASSLTLDVFIYATRSTRSNEKEKTPEQHEGLVLSYGVRPDLNKLLGQYIEAAQGSVAMLHCGPSRMSDQIRQISALHGVAYMEEAFEW